MKVHVDRLMRIGIAASCLWAVAATADMPQVEYRPRIRGLSDRSLESEIRDMAITFRLDDQPPATIGQLRRRVEGDVPRIESILDAQGYYDAQVFPEIDMERDPLRVTFRIEPGEQYRFRDVHLRFYGSPDPALEEIRPRVRSNSRAVAARIFEEQQRIIEQLQRMGYPFPELAERRVIRDPENRQVDVHLTFDVGLAAIYGGFEIEGAESVSWKYFKRQLPWRSGDRFDIGQLSDFESTLLGSGLFATVRVEPVEGAGETNAVPVRITVRERNPRTIRLGVNYSDIGFGARILWEHRNLFGNGERLETSLTGSEIELGAKASLSRPGFLRANQSIVFDVDASYETPDAYDSRKLRTLAMVLRDFTPGIQGGVGAGYQYSRVEQLASDERYGLVFFPLQAVLDYRDDRLNPVKGYNVLGRTSYFHDTLGTDSFLKSGVEGRHYLTLWERFRLSSALRMTLGIINGESIDAVPADERFYAGGGGSIRGYEYQAVGPQAGGTPVGGDRLVEFSAELRMQPGRRLGFAAFVDGGAIFNDVLPNVDDSMRYGAGVGLRWFTGIGPLRLDAAYPLNPDDTQVERTQFYISLGQAF